MNRRAYFWPIYFCALWILLFFPAEKLFFGDATLPHLAAIILCALPMFNAVVAEDRILIHARGHLMVAFTVYFTWAAVSTIFLENTQSIAFAKSVLNLAAAHWVGISMAYCYKKSNAREMALIACLVFATFFTALAAEAMLPGLFDGLRAVIHSSSYDANLRDLALWGIERPMFIFQEPSFAGIFMSVLMLIISDCLRIIRPNAYYIFALVSSFACFFVLRSVTVLSGLLFLTLVQSTLGLRRRPGSELVLSILLVCSYVVGTFVSVGMFEGLSELGYSSGARLATPFLILQNEFGKLWLVGTGLGILPDLVFSSVQGVALDSETNKYLVTNSWLEFFIYHGILFGGVCILIWQKFFQNVFGFKLFPFLLGAMTFFSLVGGAVTVVGWVCLYVCAIVFKSDEHTEELKIGALLSIRI